MSFFSWNSMLIIDFCVVKHVSERSVLHGFLQIWISTQVLTANENIWDRTLASYFCEHFLPLSAICQLVKLDNTWLRLSLKLRKDLLRILTEGTESLWENEDWAVFDLLLEFFTELNWKKAKSWRPSAYCCCCCSSSECEHHFWFILFYTDYSKRN